MRGSIQLLTTLLVVIPLAPSAEMNQPVKPNNAAAIRSSSPLDEYVGTARAFLELESARTLARRTSARLNNQAVDENLGADIGSDEPVIATGERKSPKKAFFLSLLLPGLGEFYAGNNLRAGIFMGVEAASWSAWSIYRGKGNDKRDEYIAYQAEHWSFDRYDAYRNAVWRDAAVNTGLFNMDDPLSKRQQDSLSVLIGTHHYDDCCGQEMPDADDQYETIGKYYRFSYGWDDATYYADQTLLSDNFPQSGPGEDWGTNADDWRGFQGAALVRAALDTTTGLPQVQHLEKVGSENRETYMGIRGDANDQFSTAQSWTTVILFNHLVSAIHAARMVKKMNKTGELEAPRTSLRMVMYPSDQQILPMLVMQRRF
jgi:hypothetical protein